MTVLIDSWTWIEYFRGTAPGRKASHAIDGSEEAAVSVINLAEIYHWFLRSQGVAKAEEARGIIRVRCTVLPVTEEIALEAAKLRHERKWGLGDCLVYATAQTTGARLLTGDPDFRGAADVEFLG